MVDLPYTTLPAPPGAMRAGTALARLVDAIGFRYRWATEGLDESILAFRPAEGAHDLRGLLGHVHDLVAWVRDGVAAPRPRAPRPQRLEDVRRATLAAIVELREALLALDDPAIERIELVHPTRGRFPIWNAINGPLADALTHVGQVNSWRRIAGNPTPPAHVFLGTPPHD